MLWLYRRVVFGEITNPHLHEILDLNAREKLMLYPMVAIVLWLGVYPAPLENLMSASVENLLLQIRVSPHDMADRLSLFQVAVQ
jgi:NADH-quinone oxidoreductase subunit M